MEFSRKRRLILGVAVAAVGVLTIWLSCFRPAPLRQATAYPIPGLEIAGQVEVLNGTGVEGLARTVTRTLRIAGIDVVAFGNHRTPAETTRVLVRRGDSAAAVAVRAVLGLGVVGIERDSSLLLDVSVVLGADFLGPPDSMPE